MRDNRYRSNNASGNHNRLPTRDPLPPKKEKHTFEKVLIIGFLLFVFGSLGYKYYKNHVKEIGEKIESIFVEDENGYENLPELTITSEEEFDDITLPREVTPSKSLTASRPSTRKEEKTTTRKDDNSDLSSLEIIERQNHERAVEQARRTGVSTEGSTIDILERINHKQVVEQGKRAGVSTEGSTVDILERINHKQIVEQGRRAGVSTEGSTVDILERINHKQVVEQARRAGVSTEGSTSDILERISRKRLQERGF